MLNSVKNDLIVQPLCCVFFTIFNQVCKNKTAQRASLLPKTISDLLVVKGSKDKPYDTKRSYSKEQLRRYKSATAKYLKGKTE